MRLRDHSPSWILAFSIAVAMCAALAHVWIHLQVIAMGYDLSREQQLHQKLIEANQQLNLELRTRMDLAGVERAARERLHMAPPDPRAIRVVRANLPALGDER